MSDATHVPGCLVNLLPPRPPMCPQLQHRPALVLYRQYLCDLETKANNHFIPTRRGKVDGISDMLFHCQGTVNADIAAGSLPSIYQIISRTHTKQANTHQTQILPLIISQVVNATLVKPPYSETSTCQPIIHDPHQRQSSQFRFSTSGLYGTN